MTGLIMEKQQTSMSKEEAKELANRRVKEMLGKIYFALPHKFRRIWYVIWCLLVIAWIGGAVKMYGELQQLRAARMEREAALQQREERFQREALYQQRIMNQQEMRNHSQNAMDALAKEEK